MILTCPIRLWYDAEGLQAYPVRYLLPMVPVDPPPTSPSLSEIKAQRKATQGREVLKRIIDARIDPHSGLLEPEAVECLINKSGGVLRDLLYMLREAALSAILSQSPYIGLTHAEGAALLLRNDYANRLSPPGRGTPTIGFEDMKRALGAPTDWPRRDGEHTPAFKLLLQTLCILEYNGETWHNLHPLIRDYLLLKEAEEAERRRRLTPAT